MTHKNSMTTLSLAFGLLIIVAAAIGLFYSDGGGRFEIVNMYGDVVLMHGDGVYAYNSVVNAANAFGANVSVILSALILVALTLWRRRPLWAETVRVAEIVWVLYPCASLLFGISMNRLYLVYATCFGLGVFSAFSGIRELFARLVVQDGLKVSRPATGTGIFLIVAAVLVGGLWAVNVLSVNLSGNYGSLLGIQTNELSYGLDLAIICPLMFLSGVRILHGQDSGYKAAPLLLGLLLNVAVMVILQQAFCKQLGIAIPIQALITMIVLFVILGGISLVCFVLLVRAIARPVAVV